MFRKLGEREVYRGHLISVATASFSAPDGSEFERDVVHHPGAVSVVPVVDEGTAVLLVRQYRAAVDGVLLEIPAGKRDVVDEPPATTARRELEEEVGMRAGRLEKLAEFYNSPGFCDEHSYVFMALDLTPCPSSAQGIEEEHMTIERVSLEDVPGLVSGGQIVDAKTIIGLCLAREALA
ncbi:MAG: ADP-ribose pyrophosphatase [Actinomycetota bacterium]|nr:ADP-ribose pyrophosphatase [Actinomycetota bacterium]